MERTDFPLNHLPSPAAIHRQIGKHLRELTLLRRLLRLSQAAKEEARAGRQVAVTEGGCRAH
jgi:hypothetical protein